MIAENLGPGVRKVNIRSERIQGRLAEKPISGLEKPPLIVIPTMPLVILSRLTPEYRAFAKYSYRNLRL